MYFLLSYLELIEDVPLRNQTLTATPAMHQLQ